MNKQSAQMLEVSLLGAGTVLRLEDGAPSRGCVVNGQMAKASIQGVPPFAPYCSPGRGGRASVGWRRGRRVLVVWARNERVKKKALLARSELRRFQR